MDKQALGIKLLKKSECLLSWAEAKYMSRYRQLYPKLKKKSKSLLYNDIDHLYGWVVAMTAYYFLHNKKIFRKHYKMYKCYKILKMKGIHHQKSDMQYLRKNVNFPVLSHLCEHIINTYTNTITYTSANMDTNTNTNMNADAQKIISIQNISENHYISADPFCFKELFETYKQFLKKYIYFVRRSRYRCQLFNRIHGRCTFGLSSGRIVTTIIWDFIIKDSEDSYEVLL